MSEGTDLRDTSWQSLSLFHNMPLNIVPAGARHGACRLHIWDGCIYTNTNNTDGCVDTQTRSHAHACTNTGRFRCTHTMETIINKRGTYQRGNKDNPIMKRDNKNHCRTFKSSIPSGIPHGTPVRCSCDLAQIAWGALGSVSESFLLKCQEQSQDKWPGGLWLGKQPVQIKIK